jgi:pSer/pThr/pTyr-binding forkhead associated (FHA) protein
LIRIDAGHSETYPVRRRTRIGRAPGCEVLVDSSSVSRHHALLLTNLRDVIVEDLRSTNGVLVNGRRVSRQLLTDGDILTVGDVEFRVSVKPGRREPELTETDVR